MFQFVFCGILAAFFAYISKYKGQKHFLVLSMVIIAYIMGLQDNVSVDFSAYARNFNEIMNGTKGFAFLGLDERHSSGNIEVGWYTLNKILGSIINSYHFVALVSSIFICCVIYKMLKYVDWEWYWLSIIYFYFINMQFCMSGIRQAMAMMCFMLTTLFFIEKKWKNLTLTIILGLSFHNSFLAVLCLLPLLIIPDNFIEKHIKKIIVICFIAYIIILSQSNSIRLLLINEFMSNLEEHASDYDGYLISILEAKSSLANTLFRFINFIFIVIGFYYSKAKERKLLLFYLISTYTIAIVGENSALARINNYLSIFAILAIAIIPSSIKNKLMRNAFLALTIVYIVKTIVDRTSIYLYEGYNNFSTILF